MNVDVFLAVESAIPPDHPVSMLAIPIAIVIFVGSVYLLLWSNYGAKKALAITGVAWSGFAALLGIFWWFGAPGIPPGLGINHLPGQATDHYVDQWYGFEPGSERAEFFSGIEDLDQFVPPHEYLGLPEQEGADRPDLEWTSLMSLASEAQQLMQDQFLPVDDNGIAQIGADRRASLTEEANENMPEEADGPAPTFFSAMAETDVVMTDDPETGAMLATAEFQAYANFVDADDVPLDPVPVGEPVNWFAFYDPGAEWIPSALWTGVALLIFFSSLAWLDAMETREKRLASDEVEEPERLAVPISQ